MSEASPSEEELQELLRISAKPSRRSRRKVRRFRKRALDRDQAQS